jgi:hypothetical protein
MLWRCYIDLQSTTWCIVIPEQKSAKSELGWSKECSAENRSPESNPGLKRTKMDAILKIFVFVMKFNLQINFKWDHANFRPIQ